MLPTWRSPVVDADRYFQTLGVPAALFFHPPREMHVLVRRKEPLQTELPVAGVANGAQQNRRRLVHSLATLDSQVIVDGGWTLPMGEEGFGPRPDCRLSGVAGSELPHGRGRAVGGPRRSGVIPRPCGDTPTPRPRSRSPSRSALPYDGHTYLYAVNDVPFPTTARLHVSARPACHIEELSGGRKSPRCGPTAARLLLGGGTGALRPGCRAAL